MNQPSKMGTREWSTHSDNVVLGCPNRCRYCYARANAVRRKQCPSYEAWGKEYHRVRPDALGRKRKRLKGRVMFPTTHDITEDHLEACVLVILSHLQAGNDLLIVSKPRTKCIARICRVAKPWADQVTFRFSIGAVDDAILSYWEPGAPSFQERLDCLRLAWRAGFETSVSCEPLLDAPNAVDLFNKVEPYVTDTIWFGMMNNIWNRCIPGTSEQAIAAIEAGQTPEACGWLYNTLKDHPKARWKESYCKLLGINQTVEE